jgi:hypothetical protein
VKAQLLDVWHRRIDGIEIVMDQPDKLWGFIFPGAVPGPALITLTEIYDCKLHTKNIPVVLG